MRYISLTLFVLLSIIAFLSYIIQINKINVHTDSIICIEPYKGYIYKTCKPIKYTIEGDILTIPELYKTDLASIPRIFWNIVSPARSEFMSAAILHDFLYSCHDNLSRKEIDDIFFNLLIDNGVSKKEALFFYLGVRMFGGEFFQGRCKWKLAQ